MLSNPPGPSPRQALLLRFVQQRMLAHVAQIKACAGASNPKPRSKQGALQRVQRVVFAPLSGLHVSGARSPCDDQRVCMQCTAVRLESTDVPADEACLLCAPGTGACLAPRSAAGALSHVACSCAGFCWTTWTSCGPAMHSPSQPRRMRLSSRMLQRCVRPALRHLVPQTLFCMPH